MMESSVGKNLPQCRVFTFGTTPFTGEQRTGGRLDLQRALGIE
jgi:hypothetical protein